MRYARRGMVTPEMEFIAIRENMKREEMLRMLPARHRTTRRAEFRRRFRSSSPASSFATKSRGPRHHPGQHQPSGNRADDHRPPSW
jgi:hypothetical protein